MTQDYHKIQFFSLSNGLVDWSLDEPMQGQLASFMTMDGASVIPKYFGNDMHLDEYAKQTCVFIREVLEYQLVVVSTSAPALFMT